MLVGRVAAGDIYRTCNVETVFLQRNLVGTSNSGVPLGIPSLKVWIFFYAFYGS